jgi:ATP-dependent protease HslVU (ClpYQ) peptidase subunit
MTCIVGLASGNKVFLGGDSAGVAGWELSVRSDRKVFRNGEFILGYTTSFRMGQILEHAFRPPPLPKNGASLNRYMVVDFIGAFRASLKEHGWASVQNGREEGGDFLVGVRRRLFRVASDFQVVEAKSGMDAIGSGSELARGALFATEGLLPDARRIKTALLAAEKGNAGVRGPFYVVTL